MVPAKLKEEQMLQQRQQVIEAFAEQVSLEGMRGVNMLDLAKRLKVSTKTLYKHFPTKSDLLEAFVVENIKKFNQRRSDMLLQGDNAHQRIEKASLIWLDLQTEMGERLLIGLKRDFPDVYRVYELGVTSYLQLASETLKKDIRDDLNKDFVLMMLWEAINGVPTSDVCAKFEMTRKQALIQAIEVWARGSLKIYV